MWSDRLQGRRPREVLSSSSSSTSSSSSSSCRSSPSSILQPIPRRPRTMDEVWNNISHCPNQRAQPTTGGLILQDFLAVPVFPNQIAAATPALLHPPLTILSLNPTGNDFAQTPEPNNRNDDPAAVLCFRDNTWLPEKHQVEAEKTSFTDVDGVHRQQKRMIKNRESAARSRARKQA